MIKDRTRPSVHFLAGPALALMLVTSQALAGQESCALLLSSGDQEAIAACRKAAATADAEAEWLTGHKFEALSAGRKEFFEQAARWYERAALREHALAQYSLGRLLHLGLHRTPDHPKAVFWLRKAASAGIDRAHYFLALSYQRGLGVPVDVDHAISLFRRLANSGDSWSSVALGQIYLERNDYSSAAECFGEAARRGHPRAQLQLGELFRAGKGVPHSSEEALFWLSISAASGEREAIPIRDAVAKGLSPQAQRLVQQRVAVWSRTK